MNDSAITFCEPAIPRKVCIHFWVIESANGPVSRGTCKCCGATREFKNFPTDCALENTAFRGLFVTTGKSESETGLNDFEQADYENADFANLEDDEYEKEPEALCAST